jgi:adenylate cyclase
MSPSWTIRVYDKQQLVSDMEVDGPVEVGRQSEGEPEPLALRRAESGRWRLVIARLDENTVPRRHALVEPLGPQRARVTSLSSRVAVHLQQGGSVAPEAAREVTLPLLLIVGQKTLRIEPSAAGTAPDIEGLDEATVAPGVSIPLAARTPFPLVARDGLEMESVVRWLRAALDVLQSAAGSLAFFAQAARAVVDLVGLDTARVLLLEGDQWRPQAVQAGPRGLSEGGWKPSSRLLERMLREKRTFWEVPGHVPEGSLVGVKAVVAAPILDRHGAVIGALYGDRRQESGQARPITRLEAMLVELLAGGVAAGLARLEQEQAALRARVQFEQFFTRELAQQLTREPDLLRGRDAEVSILFCDIRGFSRMTQKAGAALTMEWLPDVLGALSACVLDSGGVLIDYVGDELMAMWGAPARQDDHARLACRAALAMLGALPALNERWRPVLGEPLDLGIGINTGVARVGNVGTERKFKYGALGNTVNLASRVQGATKYLKSRLLITQATHAGLDETFAARRLRRVRVLNISGPVDLYELVALGQEGWAELRADYEKALAEFERGNFRQAARALAPLVSESVNDGPSLVLMAQAVQHLVDQPAAFDPAWDLPGK